MPKSTRFVRSDVHRGLKDDLADALKADHLLNLLPNVYEQKQTNFRRTNRKPQPIPVQTHELNGLTSLLPEIGPIADIAEGITGKGTAIAILDTGITDHQALRGRVIKMIDTTGKSINHTDGHGHGTHISGIIAAQALDASPMRGLAPDTRIILVKVTTEDYEDAPFWRITHALEQIRKHNADASQKHKITAILCCFNATDNVAKPIDVSHHRLCTLISEFYNEHIPFICSAGNNYLEHGEMNGLAYPAYIPHVIACGSLINIRTVSGVIGDYTQTSQRIPMHDHTLNVHYTVAPGYATLSCSNEDAGGYTLLSGSSQAAAVVAATVLLLQEQMRGAGPDAPLPAIPELVSKFTSHP